MIIHFLEVQKGNTPRDAHTHTLTPYTRRYLHHAADVATALFTTAVTATAIVATITDVATSPPPRLPLSTPSPIGEEEVAI